MGDRSSFVGATVIWKCMILKGAKPDSIAFLMLFRKAAYKPPFLWPMRGLELDGLDLVGE